MTALSLALPFVGDLGEELVDALLRYFSAGFTSKAGVGSCSLLSDCFLPLQLVSGLEVIATETCTTRSRY